MYPSPKDPTFGIFIKNLIEAVKKDRDFKIIIVANKIRKGGFIYSPIKYLIFLMKTFYNSLFSKFDVIFAHYLFPTGFLALIPHYLKRKPLVLMAHGTDIWLAEEFKTLRRLIGFSLRRSEKIIAVSHDLAKRIKRLYALNSDKITIASCGIDTRLFSPMDKLKAREELNLPMDKKIILFIGNLIKVKNLPHLLKAFAEIVSLSSEFILIIIGEGPLKEALLKMSEELNLSNLIKWENFKEHQDLPKWYSASDLFVMPSYSEALSLVCLESLACGVPVIAYKHKVFSEYIKDGENGFLVNVEDSKVFSQKIINLFNDENLYRNIEIKCRESALSYDISLEADKIKKILKQKNDILK